METIGKLFDELTNEELKAINGGTVKYVYKYVNGEIIYYAVSME